MINDTKSLESYSENIERLSHTKDRQYRQTVNSKTQSDITQRRPRQTDSITQMTDRHTKQTDCHTDRQYHTEDNQTDNITQRTNRQTISHKQTCKVDRLSTDRQTISHGGQTDRQYHTDRHTKQTDCHTYRQTDRQYHTDRQTISHR